MSDNLLYLPDKFNYEPCATPNRPSDGVVENDSHDSDKAARSEIGAIPSKRAHEALSAPQPRRNAEGPRRGATSQVRGACCENHSPGAAVVAVDEVEVDSDGAPCETLLSREHEVAGNISRTVIPTRSHPQSHPKSHYVTCRNHENRSLLLHRKACSEWSTVRS